MVPDGRLIIKIIRRTNFTNLHKNIDTTSQHEVYIETLPLNINHKLPLIVYDVPSIDTIDDVRNELCVIYPIQVVTGIDLESLEIILLRINGYTYKQISKKIGLSLGQVKLRIKKIREILKNC